MKKRRTAAEIIGFHLGWDMRDVSETRYQPGTYNRAALYTIGDHYFCAPSDGKRPYGWPWELVGTYYDRPVFRVHMNDLPL